MAHLQATKAFVKKLAAEGRLITNNPMLSCNINFFF